MNALDSQSSAGDRSPFELRKLWTSYRTASRSTRVNSMTGLVAFVFAMVMVFTIPHFLELRNFLNILQNLSLLGFMAIGMTYVVIAGGIDLSMYTVVSAASVVGATVMLVAHSALLGCLVMIMIGLAFGLVNGIAVAFGRMIPFIVTLSTMFLAQGFAIWFTQAQSVYDLPESYTDTIAGNLFGVVPVPALIVLLVAVISDVVLRRTRYGRWIYLIGSNERTAQVSGLPVRLTKLSTYLFSGLMAGVTAVVITAMIQTATVQMVADDRLMDIIAAVIIGGASLTGGIGSILGTVLGLLFITILGNCFNLLGVSPFVAMVIKGFVLVIVVSLDALRSR